ncbi:MAG TPA: hypothetical protein DCX89_09485 [Saprospirales bacterium]|nr:hypothetical protein [Saprospirales bacterium]
MLFLIISCYDNDADEFKKNCPYELAYSGHYLRIPITVSPHKLQYKVGDTIQISTIFSDSIYDLGTRQTFKIEGFPFKPTALLFRVKNDNAHDSGFRVNELKIDSIYRPYLWYSNIYADGFNGRTIYENEQYKFEIELILKEPGRYILLFSDIFQDYNASGNSDLNAEANAITFEGKCPTLPYYLCSMIDSGDDNLKHFQQELIYLDEKVYRGKLAHIGSNALDPLYPGSIGLEFSGFFGFEVIE